jgi:hypothetical protein
MKCRLVQALGHVEGRYQLDVLYAWIEPEDEPRRLKTVDGEKVAMHQYSNYFEVKELEWHS